MPRLKVQDKTFDCDAVVFDKDGTLIDFHSFWVTRAVSAVERLKTKTDLDDLLAAKIYRSVGLSPETKTVSSTGPLATAPLYKFYVVVACVLYQNGWNWHDAEHAVGEHIVLEMTAPADLSTVETLGNIKPVIETLKYAGVKTAIATADDRHITEDTLSALELSHSIDLVLCGDDDFVGSKPSADVLRYVAKEMAIQSSKIMMVGDTVGDMLTGINGGAGMIVAVRGGASLESDLEKMADAVVDSIEEITVAIAN